MNFQTCLYGHSNYCTFYHDLSFAFVFAFITGCGPSGMFFLHALATKRKQLLEAGDMTALKALPQVTVFEKASSPGGVWRSNRNQGQDVSNSTDTLQSTVASTNMYEGLWTNGHKDGMEFFDYTYEDHFKAPQPVYMPRKQILEYVLKRVTLHENIFKHVHFSTEVKSVTYDNDMNKIAVVTTNAEGVTTTQYYDKCVWASGLNGKPNMVSSIAKNLSSFKGQVVHSSQMDSLGASVKGKNIVLVGGNLSAEDLALSFIKLGVEKVYITSRNSADVIHYTKSWPGDKVEVKEFSELCGSADDGKTLRICQSDADGVVEDVYAEIPDVSIVVLCTGYKPNIDYLDPSLMPCSMTGDCKKYSIDDEDWEMEANLNTNALGHVEPSEELDLNDAYMDRVLIDNPNMFFIHEMATYPLIEIDVAAWMCMAFMIGDTPIPTNEEMWEHSRLDLLRSMQSHSERYLVDEEYWYAVEKKLGLDEIDLDELDKEGESFKAHFDHDIRQLAQKMTIGNYPFNLGTIEKLNKAGEKFMKMAVQGEMSRLDLKFAKDADKIWKTFRDADPSHYESFISGMKSTPLKGRWLEIDDDGNIGTDFSGNSAENITSIDVGYSYYPDYVMQIVPTK